MDDLTIVYYTANTIPEKTGQLVRDYLLKVTENRIPIISVSQKPIDLGHNICLGDIGRSKYNCYKQILVGVREVKTKYVACAEDDALYSLAHFQYRPPDGVFAYETNMYQAEELYYWRAAEPENRGGMWGCIATTEALLKNLTTRYEMYPIDPWSPGSGIENKYLFWGEPGSNDQKFGMDNKRMIFETKDPTVVFRYYESMGGFRGSGRGEKRAPENRAYNLMPHGGIRKLMTEYWQ